MDGGQSENSQASTADTESSGFSAVDELECILNFAVLSSLLPFLEPADISALASSSIEYSERLPDFTCDLAVYVIYNFFLSVQRRY